MPATSTVAPDATPALNFAAIDARAEQLGIEGKAALAEHLGIERTTLWRYRTGRVTPPLDTAQLIARRLGLPLGDIQPAEAA